MLKEFFKDIASKSGKVVNLTQTIETFPKLEGTAINGVDALGYVF